MSDKNLDKIYELLQSIRWRGPMTDAIVWARDGDVAVATFGTFDAAPLFVHGYLDDDWMRGSCFVQEDTEQTRKQRGYLHEDFFSRRTKALDVAFSDRTSWGVPATARIPLDFLIEEKLQNLIDRQQANLGNKPKEERLVLTT